MIVIDSSALIAIVFGEPEAEAFSLLIAASETAYISTVSVLEAAIVADHAKSTKAGAEFDTLFESIGATAEPPTMEHVHIAREAYRRFGRGNHPARLNFGDCFAYALAMQRGAPLLYKGNDFSQTDVKPAL
jgi:ribonuclease VapC